jgi:endonuclease/exonuclease/phosphatase family metal-dependent hydrolase
VREAENLAAVDGRFSRGAVRATVEKGGVRVTVLGVHLPSGETFADEAARVGEVEALLQHATKWKGEAHVLAGDFNATHPEQVVDVAKLRPKSRARVEAQGGKIPREAVARVLAAGYVDGHAVGRPPEQFGVSMTTSHPAMRTDYIFVPAALVPTIRGCEVFAPEIARFASDHYPVVAEFAFDCA